MHQASDKLFDVAISIDTGREMRFENPMELTEKHSGIESASLTGDGALTCIVKVRSASVEEAVDRGLLFANRVADILAYKYRVKIKSVALVTCSEKDGNGVTINIRSGLQINASLNRVAISEDRIALSQLISRELQSDGYDLLSMYRQARGEESILARYLLLYRLLEYRFQGSAKVDAWIMKKRSNTEQIQGRKRMKTIYTHLRDKIHPSTIQFPYLDVGVRVGELEDLARQALEEGLHPGGGEFATISV